MAEHFVPPQNVEAEQAVLGSMLLGGRKMAIQARELLDESDFYRVAHSVIFNAMCDIVDRGAELDAVTLKDELERTGDYDLTGGAPYIIQLGDCVPTTANMPFYAEIVKDASLKRRVILSLESTIANAWSWTEDGKSLVGAVQSLALELTKTASDAKKGPTTMTDALAEGLRSIRERNKSKVVRSGLTDLDYFLTGFVPGRLYVFACPPGIGKTALAAQCGLNAAKRGAKVDVFSAEMTADQYAMRLAYAQAVVDGHRFESGTLPDSDVDRLLAAIEKLSDIPIFIHDGVTDLSVLTNAVRAAQIQRGSDLVIVDYLQLMRGERSPSREQEVASLAYGLKNELANAIPIPVIALSQVNDEGEVRESRAIKMACDVLVKLEPREDRVPGKPQLMEARIDKNRWGPTGKVALYFDHEHCRFLGKSEREGSLY